MKKIIHNIFNGRWITQKDDTDNRIIVNIYKKMKKFIGKFINLEKIQIIRY